MIQSPLNYTGGKYKLLPQILPLFPENINAFVDLFCGGCNVGINVDCNRVIYNDLNENLLYLYNTFKNLDKESVLEWIYEIIEKYGLSLVSKNGYDYYGCESSKGLGDYNREGYLKLRADFNQKHANGNFDYYYYVMLYVIIVYAFNNQIRFNSNGEFNLPVGKRDFNKKMEQKLIDFIDKIQEQNCIFTCRDFREFDTSKLTSKDFVYVDPPYLITCATYNEQGGAVCYDEVIEFSTMPGVDVIPADMSLATLGVDSEYTSQMAVRAMRDLRDAVIEDDSYDYVIFDCPPAFSQASIGAIAASSEVIIPLKIGRFEIEGMDELIEQIESVRKINPATRIAGALLTMWHNSPVVRDGEEYIRETCPVRVFRTMIRRTDKVDEAVFARKAITEWSPTSAAARDYRAWVEELMGVQ